MKLDNFDVKTFLSDYWQKKPMVIRRAFSDPYWLEPDDLAGLSLEEEAESRLIIQEKNEWKLEHGPFEEARFSSLPKTDWTLLVQGVDQWVPEIKEILSGFSFLPSWRLDDIMVSYAPTGGTVSQHYDFYDVFLIQGEGSRKWQVGSVCGSHSELVPDMPVRILKEFEAELEVTLNPGDMLYIPSKHAHLGVSIENSLTYSVGFRSPSIRDIVDGMATTSLETLLEDDRYEDSISSLKASTGEIPQASIEQLKSMLSKALLSEESISAWFGKYVTERKYPDQELLSFDSSDWVERINDGELLYRNSASRFAYTKRNGCTLFVDGQSYTVTLSLAEQLSDFEGIDLQAIENLISDADNFSTVEQLLVCGALIFDELGDEDGIEGE